MPFIKHKPLASAVPGAAPKILVVDDTPEIAGILLRILQRRGYAVKTVDNGAAALAACKKELPDLVLLDICMPEMDGYEVCEQLKADAQTRDVPVIFVSALPYFQSFPRTRAVGGKLLIPTPFTFEEVEQAIDHILARK